MATLATLLVNVIADTTGFVGGMGKAQTALMGLSAKFATAGAAMSAAGSKMTRTLTLPIVAVGAAAAKMSMDFEESMNHIDALVGASDKQMGMYRTTVLKMAVDLPQAPRELADALYFVTSAGFKGQEALDILDASARAAAAGLGETKVVADAVTSAVNAYGIENLKASSATDVLLATIREGKAEPEELAGSIGKVIPVAEAMGVEFAEVGASIASMTLAGLNSSEASTAIRGLLTGLLKPSTDAREAFDQIGLSVDDMRKNIAEKGLMQTLTDLRERIGDNKDMLGRLFPNVRALAGFLNLTGRNAEKNSEIFKALTSATGDTDRAFASASETVGFKWKSAISTAQVALINLGDALAPVVLSLANGISAVSNAFTSLDPATQQTIIKVAALIAVIGPALKILGLLTKGVGLLFMAISAGISVFNGLVVGAGLLMKALSFLWAVVTTGAQVVQILYLAFGPWLLVAAAVAAAAILIWKNWDTVKKFLVAALDVLKNAFAAAWGAITNAFSTAFNAIKGMVAAVWNSAVVQAIVETLGVMVDRIKLAWDMAYAIISGALSVIASVIKVQFEVVKAVISGALAVIIAIWTVTWGAIKDALSVVWAVIKTVVTTGINVLKMVIGPPLLILKALWQTTWDAMSKILSVVWTTIKTIVTTAWQIVQGIFKAALAVLRGDWGAAWDAIKEVLSAAWNGIKTIVSAAISAVVSFMAALPGRILGALGNIAKLLWNSGQDLITGLWDGIKTIVELVLRFFINLPGRLLSALGDMAMALFNAGKALIQGLINGIKSMVGAALDAVKNVGKTIINGALSVFGIHSPSKVFERIGIDLMAGLIVGMQKQEGKLLSQLDKLAAKIKDNLAGAIKKARLATVRELEKMVNDVGKILDKAQKQYDKVVDKMSNMADALASGMSTFTNTLEKFKDFKHTVKIWDQESQSLKEVETNQAKTAQDFVDMLTKDVGAAANFAANIEALAKKGLNDTTLAQLASSGDIGTARILNSATDAQIQAINEQVANLDKYQKMFTERVNNILYGKEFEDAFRLLKEAGKEFDRLEKVIAKFADQVQADIDNWKAIEAALAASGKEIEDMAKAIAAIVGNTFPPFDTGLKDAAKSAKKNSEQVDDMTKAAKQAAAALRAIVAAAAASATPAPAPTTAATAPRTVVVPPAARNLDDGGGKKVEINVNNPVTDPLTAADLERIARRMEWLYDPV